MSPERFDNLLSMATSLIAKEGTNFRKSISPEERLAVTLRFLASGKVNSRYHFHTAPGHQL